MSIIFSSKEAREVAKEIAKADGLEELSLSDLEIVKSELEDVMPIVVGLSTSYATSVKKELELVKAEIERRQKDAAEADQQPMLLEVE